MTEEFKINLLGKEIKVVKDSDGSFIIPDEFRGLGSSLKPALEPITVARKPLAGTVAENVLRWGTGGLNVDGCRVGSEARWNTAAGNKAGGNSLNMSAVGMPQDADGRLAVGRWPANLIHDGSDEVVGLFPRNVPGSHQQQPMQSDSAAFGGGRHDGSSVYADSGSAARFFYCAKCNKNDRNAGLGDSENGPQTNGHPTVKPTDLMRYLCRLVTPPGGTVLDPFMGSGSTGKAAMKEGFNFIGIDMDEAYVEIAEKRIAHACLPEPPKETKKKKAK